MKWFNLLICAFSFLSMEALFVEGYLGINWGRLATQRMIPSMVVDLLLQNKINEVKLFSASDNVLEAFGETKIGLAITMPNQETQAMKSLDDVQMWVYKNIGRFNNVNFTYVCIGTQPLSTRLFNKSYPESIQVLDWTQQALNNVHRQDIKATMSHLTDVLIPVQKPSDGDFKDDVKDLVTQSCKILMKNNAPIGLDVFPLLSVNDLFNNDTEFAFFDNNSTSVFKDGNKTYKNVFEVIYDMYDVALEKAGCPNMTIIVDEIGWPTDGIKDGNIPNARRFHQGLAKFAASNKGTPRRPGPINFFIHNLSDENKINKRAGPFMRHWGIYQFDGQPKFHFDLQGLERDTKLIPAVGITYMPKRWCIFDESFASDIGNEMKTRYMEPCNTSLDCTTMDAGGSCSNLTDIQQLSYVFNMGFQKTIQKVVNKSCDYDGYGKIVSNDPSTPSCKFPVEILAAEIPNFNGNVRNLGCNINPSFGSLMVGVIQMLFILFGLICVG